MTTPTLYRNRFSALSLAGLVSVSTLAALAPTAARAETKENTTQFEVTAGTLKFVTAPAVPMLGSVTLKGEAETTHGTMSNFSVQDATGSGDGWNVTVQGQTGTGKSAVFKQYCETVACGTVGYVSGGIELAANSLTLNSTSASFTGEGGTTGTAPTLPCASGCDVDHASAVTVAEAATSAGMGTWATTGFTSSSLSLSTPSTLKLLSAHEVYRVNLLWTLSTGP